MKMLKKSLMAVVVLAMVVPAFAGQIKVHTPWPCAPIPQEVAKIDVTMDVGWWINITDQKPIKVDQDTTSTDPFHTYVGCKKVDVKSNFNAQFVLEVSSASAAGGSWSATANPNPIGPGTTNVEFCVKGTGVKIENLTGGSTNVKVATLSVKVLPAV
jgi:hypothetical protein